MTRTPMLHLACLIDVSGRARFDADFAWPSGAESPTLSVGAWSRFRAFESGGVLTELMGARLFLGPLEVPGYADVIDGALEVNNGTLEPDLSFKGGVYFDRLQIVAPVGYRLVTIPRYGEWTRDALDVATGIAEGARYVIADGAGYFPARARLTRRFLLVKGGDPAHDRLLRRTWLAGGYDEPRAPNLRHPQAHLIPERLGRVLEGLRAEHSTLSYDGAYENGSPRWAPHRGPWLGWGNLRNPGQQDGSDIHLCPDWSGTAAGGRYAALVGDLVAERHDVACYLSDGRLATRSELGTSWPYDLYRGGTGVVPNFGHYGDRDVGTPNGCPYMDDRVDSAEIDVAHLIRAFGYDLAASNLIGDKQARHRLLTCAEDMRLGLYEERLNSGSDYELPSLELALRNAKANPHAGGDILRSMGWAMKLAGAAHNLDPFSSHWGKWCSMAAELAGWVQLTSGFSTAEDKAGNLNQGEPFSTFGLPEGAAVSVTWQAPFYIDGLVAIDPELTGQTVAQTMAHALYANGLGRVDAEVSGQEGNPRYAVVKKGGIFLDPVHQGVGPARPFYDRHAIAIAAMLAEDAIGRRRWLERMFFYGPPASNLYQLLHQLENGAPEDTAYAWRVVRAHLARDTVGA